METAMGRLGTLLYMVRPNATTFQHASQVPDYVTEAVPLFVIFSLLELCFGWAVDRPERLNEALSNLSLGILHEVGRLVVSGMVLFGYEWLYQYRLWDWAWDSIYTWLAAVVLVDFCYYWIHRANHELNILWAIHQVHHGSESYNFTTALRSSIFQKLAHFGFYQPLALVGIPLPAVLVHSGLNLVVQFWIHSAFVGRFGPLEWVIVTPSFHRVHHGANKWCLDKNYASMFVLWDLLFGTFQLEPQDSQIVYGLTRQTLTHNALWSQFYYFGDLIRKVRSMTTWTDSLKAMFYGPGWSPGTPRLGNPDLFPEVTAASRENYGPQLPNWQLAYIGSHLLVAILQQQLMATRFMSLSWSMMGFILVSMGVVTAMLDGWRWAGLAEAARCTLYVLYARTTLTTHSPFLDNALILYFTLCAILWTCHGLAPRIKTSDKEKLY